MQTLARRSVTSASVEAATTEKVAFLASGQGFAPHQHPVTVIETHMSWVFLGRTLVLKMKKPVRFPFLDFTTLERRRHNCEAEVRLNRRLAGDVYQGLVAVRRGADGQLTTGSEGEVVEWLVLMRRLPHSEFLDERIRTHRVTASDISALAGRLARFYRASPAAVADGEAYIRHLLVESEVNRQVLLDPLLNLQTPRTRITLDAIDARLAHWTPVIRERIARGFIVEGHGDLRPGHICLIDPPVIFDCLEFDRNMRLLDPYDEVSFLGLECAMLGSHRTRLLLLDDLARQLGNRPEAGLLAIYGAFRAALRARLCLAHLLETPCREPARWQRQSKRYLAVADRMLRSSPR